MENRRRYSGVMGKVVKGITITFAVYMILFLSGIFNLLGIYIYDGSNDAIVFAFILVFTFLNFPAHKNATKNRLPWYDILLIILGLVGTIYIAVNAADIVSAQKQADQFQ